MLKQWVKICGIQTVSDAERCFELGASAIGLNLWPPSPRSVTFSVAAEIATAVHGRGDIVLLVVNHPQRALEEALKFIKPSWLQFHGDESETLTAQYGRIAYKAIGLATEQDAEQAKRWPGEVVLVDAKNATMRGGTGKSPPERLAKAVCSFRPTILAGGLTPENVKQSILEFAPAGVDTASGVESTKGILDFEKVGRFIHEAKHAFELLSSSRQK